MGNCSMSCQEESSECYTIEIRPHKDIDMYNCREIRQYFPEGTILGVNITIYYEYHSKDMTDHSSQGDLLWVNDPVNLLKWKDKIKLLPVDSINKQEALQEIQRLLDLSKQLPEDRLYRDINAR